MAGAPGTVGLQAQLDVLAGAAVVGADRLGNVFYVGPAGVTKLDASLSALFTYPHGDVLAIDSQGNAYVAGAFRTPTDFGTGVIQPGGNVDVFIAKLSPSGDVLAVTTLGDCGGDGLRSIALDASTGRIAVSGDAMGTAVVDGNGALLFRLAAAGHLAFDTQGNLVVAGAFAGGIDLGNGHRLSTSGNDDFDGFVARYGVDGRYQLGVQLGDVALPYTAPWGQEITTPRQQAVAGVATGPDDSIAITGAFLYEIDILGQTFSHPASASESGPFSGPFVAKLDNTGALVFAESLAGANAGIAIGGTAVDFATVDQGPGTAIAVNANGDIFVSNNQYGNAQPPFAYPQLSKFDGTSGATVWGLFGGTGFSGYGLGVALDGCGNVVWASQENNPSIEDPHVIVSKLPQ